MPRPSILALLATLGIAACSSGSHDTAADAGPTIPDDGGSDDAGADASVDAPTLVTEPDQGMQPIYDFISSAKKSIDMTMYEQADTKVTGLLTTAAAKGLLVRVILDQNLEQKSNTAAYQALSAGKVEVHWANPVYASTHQKTITVDGTTSAIMTLNLAPEDYATSRDFAVITSDAADVAAIEAVFAADLVNASITPPTGDNLVWSPTNAQTALLDVINTSKSSLLVENEEMSDDAVVEALAKAASRGVDVKVIMEDSTTYATEFAELVQSGVKLMTYSHGALYIHAKVILADYGTSGAQVFIGSENFTRTSLTENRELGLITTNPAIMASIDGTLTSDFNGGTPYVVPPPGGDAGTTGADAGASDAGANDADAGASDAGASDAGASDADAGASDAG